MVRQSVRVYLVVLLPILFDLFRGLRYQYMIFISDRKLKKKEKKIKGVQLTVHGIFKSVSSWNYRHCF